MILFPDKTMSIERVGGKAMALYELSTLPVPEWFVVTDLAFQSCELNRDYPEKWKVSHELKKEISVAMNRLSKNESDRFAVRSSAVDEDGSGFSFAGQLESYLGVKTDNVCDRIVDVWRSAFSERIVAYRKENKLGECRVPGVIVQRMVAAKSAGVAFSVDPVGGYWDRAIVTSVWGLGSALVDGSVDSDIWQVDRKGQILNSDIADKKICKIMDDEGEKETENNDAIAKQASLNEDQVKKVAELARTCSLDRKSPQDIEWAWDEKGLYLLQSRPITSLGRVSDPEGLLAIWDNSNIAESYGGVTTPLTYSFARSIYEAVYRQFCRLMAVPEKVIRDNEETFKGLLGLMNGRMYYNLLNWYRLLACFPGFSINRGFMEQMMGVQEELAEELAANIKVWPSTSKFTSLFYFSKSIAGMIYNLFSINKQVKKFYARLNKALVEPKIPLNQQSADELIASYRDLESQLLLKWDAPLVNDFFAMIFYGVLKNLCVKWCGDEDGTLQNDLVGGEGEVISAEPAKRVKEMANLIADQDELVELFKSGKERDILLEIPRHPKLESLFNAYIKKFGDRCLDELKLESPTLHDNPLPLLRAIGHFVGRESTVQDDHAKEARIKAEEKAFSAIGDKKMRRRIFKWVLNQARARVKDRENLRFERTRLFGRVRGIMKQLGQRFAAYKVIDKAEDIFYLEKDEIFAWASGTLSVPCIKDFANIRKKQFETFKDAEPIADRFKSHSMVFVGNDFSFQEQSFDQALAEDERKGIGCCPGKVRGKVCVVRDPRGVELPAGTILVAERTDPGWIMLFPAASGLLVEKGSLLSHSAIVSRELGLPSIVSVPGITRWLQDGDEVEFDGSSGMVRLIKKVE